MFGRIRVVALLLLALSPLSHAEKTSSDVIDLPHEEWREGPIRYIITSDEDREYKKLRDPADRTRFIRGFWARRDPDPRTLVNEFRLDYWNRVVSSNELFTHTSKPGWKTDMGRHYILLGPPDDRDENPFGTTGAGRGAIVWRYRRAPTARIGAGLTIVFTRDASGEYATTTDPAVVEQVLSNTLQPTPADGNIFGIPLPQLPPRITELELLLDQGRLEHVPSEEELLTAIVTAEEFFGVIPISARYDFFASSADRTITAITLNMHPDPLDPLTHESKADYLIVGRLDPIDAPGAEPIYLREREFSPSSHNNDFQYHGPYIYQAVVTVPPGHYSASFAAFDRRTRKTGSYSETFEIPSFSHESLGMSSLCLSESIKPVSAGEGAPRPYVIGHLEVTPRLIPAYRNGDTFAVYYQIYSAVGDEETDEPNLEIEYQFHVKQPTGYLPIGRPISFDSVRFPAQGWSFPMQNWPAADFKLEVKVLDTISGQTAVGEVFFKVL